MQEQVDGRREPKKQAPSKYQSQFEQNDYENEVVVSKVNYEDRVAKANGKKVIPAEIANGESSSEELIECGMGCGRRFNRKALEKHEKICQKVFQDKREQFNSKDHRLNEELANEQD